MKPPEPDAYRRIWDIIEALAGASVGEDQLFAARLATSEELQELEVPLRLRGHWREP